MKPAHPKNLAFCELWASFAGSITNTTHKITAGKHSDVSVNMVSVARNVLRCALAAKNHITSIHELVELAPNLFHDESPQASAATRSATNTTTAKIPAAARAAIEPAVWTSLLQEWFAFRAKQKKQQPMLQPMQQQLQDSAVPLQPATSKKKRNSGSEILLNNARNNNDDDDDANSSSSSAGKNKKTNKKKNAKLFDFSQSQGAASGRNNNTVDLNNSEEDDDDDGPLPATQRQLLAEQQYPAAWKMLNDRLSLAELRRACSDHNFSVTGSKVELARRLLSYFAATYKKGSRNANNVRRATQLQQQQSQHNGSQQQIVVVSQNEHVTSCAAECVNMLKGTADAPLNVDDDDDNDELEDDDDDDDPFAVPKRRMRTGDNSSNNKNVSTMQQQSKQQQPAQPEKKSLDFNSVLAHADALLGKHGFQAKPTVKPQQQQQQQQQHGAKDHDGFSLPTSPLLDTYPAPPLANKNSSMQQQLQQRIAAQQQQQQQIQQPEQPKIPRVTIASFVNRPRKLADIGGLGGFNPARRRVLVCFDSRERIHKTHSTMIETFQREMCPIVRDTIPTGDFVFLFRPSGVDMQQELNKRQGLAAADGGAGGDGDSYETKWRPEDTDYILPFIIERKTSEDLEKSIESTRLTVQRWHMRRSVTLRRILLVEGASLDNAANRNQTNYHLARVGTPQQYGAAVSHRNQMSTAVLSATFSTALNGVESESNPEQDQTMRVMMSRDQADSIRMICSIAFTLEELLAPCGCNLDEVEATLQQHILGKNPTRCSTELGELWGMGRDTLASTIATASSVGFPGAGRVLGSGLNSERATTSTTASDGSNSNANPNPYHAVQLQQRNNFNVSSIVTTAPPPLPLLCTRINWFRSHFGFRENVDELTTYVRMLGTLRGVSPTIALEIARKYPSVLDLFRALKRAEIDANVMRAVEAERKQQQDKDKDNNNTSSRAAKQRANELAEKLEPAHILFDAVREGRTASSALTTTNSNSVLLEQSVSTSGILLDASLLMDSQEMAELLGEDFDTTTTRNDKNRNNNSIKNEKAPKDGKPPKAPKTTQAQRALCIAIRDIFRAQQYL